MYSEIYDNYIAAVKARTHIIKESNILAGYSYHFGDGEIFHAICRILNEKKIDFLDTSRLPDSAWYPLLTKENLISAIISDHLEIIKRQLFEYDAFNLEELNDVSVKNPLKIDVRKEFLTRLNELIPENTATCSINNKIKICKDLAAELLHTDIEALKDKEHLSIINNVVNLLRVGVHCSFVGYLYYDRLTRQKLQTQFSMKEALQTIWQGRTLGDMKIDCFKKLIDQLTALQEAVSRDLHKPIPI